MSLFQGDSWQWWAVGAAIGLSSLTLARKWVFVFWTTKKTSCGGCGSCGSAQPAQKPLTQLVIRPKKSVG